MRDRKVTLIKIGIAILILVIITLAISLAMKNNKDPMRYTGTGKLSPEIALEIQNSDEVELKQNSVQAVTQGFTDSSDFYIPKLINSKDDGEMSLYELMETYHKDCNIKIDIIPTNTDEENITKIEITVDYKNPETEKFVDSKIITSKTEGKTFEILDESTVGNKTTFKIKGLLDPDNVLVGIGSTISKTYIVYDRHLKIWDYKDLNETDLTTTDTNENQTVEEPIIAIRGDYADN